MSRTNAARTPSLLQGLINLPWNAGLASKAERQG